MGDVCSESGCFECKDDIRKEIAASLEPWLEARNKELESSLKTHGAGELGLLMSSFVMSSFVMSSFVMSSFVMSSFVMSSFVMRVWLFEIDGLNLYDARICNVST